jgi:RNA polymerase sigma-70 factor (ECF subfamily)
MERVNTPSSLLECLRRPDGRQSWGRFVLLYTPLLYHWARRITPQDADAADLVQEVFLVLHRKLPDFSYDRHKSFRSWLRTVLLNKWRDACRRTRTMPATSDELEPAVPDTNLAVEEAEYRDYLVGRAFRLMRADFQPTTWQACWEHLVEGRPAAEVAAHLGLTVDAVYAAKSRVLRRLRQELDGLLD